MCLFCNYSALEQNAANICICVQFLINVYQTDMLLHCIVQSENEQSVSVERMSLCVTPTVRFQKIMFLLTYCICFKIYSSIF